PPREERLAERVVELVRAGVEEVLALQVDPLARREPLGQCERGGSAAVVTPEAVELVAERVVVLGLAPAGLELVQRGDQRLGDEASTVLAVGQLHRAASTYARTRA